MITDEQIIYDALRRYTITRQEFCEHVHAEGSMKHSGEDFTDEEKAHAVQVASQCDRLTSFALKKLQEMQSPIIRVN
jgi:hypothetical protein